MTKVYQQYEDESMSVSPTEQIISLVEPARELYERLILVVGPPQSGKTLALQQVRESTNAAYLNVNLALARHLLDLDERQRRLMVARRLDELVDDAGTDPVLLDNTELLFAQALQIDPLRVLQKIATNHTIVVAWNGSVEQAQLSYAWPGHPDYRRYPTRDLLIVQAHV